MSLENEIGFLHGNLLEPQAYFKTYIVKYI